MLRSGARNRDYKNNVGFVARPFKPSQITGLARWYDGADTSTISTGATFTWQDKSGNGNDATQTVAGDQPATGVDTLNGENVLTFTGDLLDIPTATFRTAIVVVSELTGPGITGALFGGDTPADGQYTFVYVNSIDASPDISVDGSVGKTGTAYFNGGTGASGTNIDLGNTNAENEGPGIWIVRFDGPSTADFIGAFGAGATTSVSGKFGEVMFYDRDLEVSELNQIGNYAGNKWALPWTDI